MNSEPTQNKASYEISAKDMFSALWSGKWLIIGLTGLFAVIFTMIAINLPDEYRATSIVQPNELKNSQQLGKLSGQLGGLAAFAGIDLGATNSSDAVIAMEIMKSWGFAESFIEKHKLQIPLFAAESWSQNTDELILDERLYNERQKKWVRSPPKGKTVEPTSWELYEKFQKRLSINQNKDTGLIEVSFHHYSPRLAKAWVDLLIEDINSYMKEKALAESNQSIEYLEMKIKETSVAEIKMVFSELIQEQHKTKMLAQVSDEFIFKTVSAAKIPEEKYKPNRVLLVILGGFLGFMLTAFVLILLRFFKG